MNKEVKALRKKFKKYDIDGYVIPKNDDYFTEYSKINRLKIISNFNNVKADNSEQNKTKSELKSKVKSKKISKK